MRKFVFGGLLVTGILGSVIAISRYINKKATKEKNTDIPKDTSDKKESSDVKEETKENKKDETKESKKEETSCKKETECKCSENEHFNLDNSQEIGCVFSYDKSPALDKDKVDSVQYILKKMIY